MLLVVIAFYVLLCAACFAVVEYQNETYGESAVNIPLVCLQTLFLVVAVLTWSRYSPGPWFYVGCVGLALSSAVGAYVSWKDAVAIAEESKLQPVISVAAQLIAPIGIVFFILLFLLMMFSDWPKKKRKHRRKYRH